MYQRSRNEGYDRRVDIKIRLNTRKLIISSAIALIGLATAFGIGRYTAPVDNTPTIVKVDPETCPKGPYTPSDSGIIDTNKVASQFSFSTEFPKDKNRLSITWNANLRLFEVKCLP